MKLFAGLAAATVMAAGTASAEPMQLTDGHMDQITAGGTAAVGSPGEGSGVEARIIQHNGAVDTFQSDGNIGYFVDPSNPIIVEEGETVIVTPAGQHEVLQGDAVDSSRLVVVDPPGDN